MKKQLTVGEPFNPYKMFVGSFIPQWLECRPEISPGGKLVYARMSRYAGKNGQCNPRQGVMAKTIGLGERQARTYLKELEENKLLESVRLGLGKSNHYRFLVHDWMFADPERQDAADQERNDAAVPDQQDTSELDWQDASAPTLLLRESFKRIERRESEGSPFSESQTQQQEKPNAEPLPTAPRSDCAAPAEQRTAAEPPTGSLRADSERPKPGVGVAGVGEDFPSWKRYVMDYYGTRDERAIEKHLKGSDKLDRLTGEKVVAWVARCGTLAEWMRSNVDGTYAGKPANGRSNGIAHGSGLNGRANGHANGKAVPQYNHVTPAQPPPIDEKTLALMVVIAMVTFKNLSITKHAELCQSAAIELSKVGANAEIITAKFGANSWWYQKDWRGQKGSCPTPAQMIEVWGQWENTNGATSNGSTARGTGNRIQGNIIRHDPNKPVDTRVYDTTLPFFPDAIAI